MLFAAFSCSEKEEGTGIIPVPCPTTEVESLAKLNEAVGCNLKLPTKIKVSEPKYSVLEATIPVADYSFTFAGGKYTVRAGKTNEDITGVWYGEKLLTDTVGENEEFGPKECGTDCWARWFEGEEKNRVQYTIVAAVPLSEFTVVYDAIRGN